MPLYEYQCENCGDVFELIEKFSAEPLTTHEKCGGKVHRLISAPALQFKGSGWYVTDYAKSGSTTAHGSDKKDGESSSDKADKGKADKKDGAKSSGDSTASNGGASSTSSDTSSSSSTTTAATSPSSSDKK